MALNLILGVAFAILKKVFSLQVVLEDAKKHIENVVKENENKNIEVSFGQGKIR